MYYFTPPIRSFAVTPSDLPYVVTFVACEMAVSQLISWRRRTEDSLRQARDELEVRVAERTAELKNANDAHVRQMAEQRRTEETQRPDSSFHSGLRRWAQRGCDAPTV
jgi:C4-dicarboxylate-specific signal transduction histidine kinase